MANMDLLRNICVCGGFEYNRQTWTGWLWSNIAHHSREADGPMLSVQFQKVLTGGPT